MPYRLSLLMSVNYKTVLFFELKFDFHFFILASSTTKYIEKLACPADLLYSLVARKWDINYDKLKPRGDLPAIACFLLATLPYRKHIHSGGVI